MERLEAVVSGRVQGVGYRAFAVAMGRQLGLRGYAKNLPDGTVEVVAEGGHEKLLHLLSGLASGPSLSRVDNVKKSFSKALGEFKEFTVRY
ncbi:MAG TPA: acylphosphatase [Candidatus Diapherotrites archaeon]|uniref:acylphosphatase n=1 Tax=Candidatus Iainarchaeum sp. TaxID=3101447 RepID=A0A7J4IXN1_9ARCH|nr:acylphosphatase [Candidatus Diapherotrites archaeon]